MNKLLFPTSHTLIRYGMFDEKEIEIPPDWRTNFNWTGRTDYLEWVAAWKAGLRQKIALIRKAKIDRRDPAIDDDKRNAAQYERQQLRIDCYNLLLLRALGKVEAGKQRDSRRDLMVNMAAD